MNMGQLVEQGTEEVFPLGFEPTSIGRHGDNEIILPDGQVSRHHAEIVMQGGRWLVADLGSANGTYVNGERLTPRCSPTAILFAWVRPSSGSRLPGPLPHRTRWWNKHLLLWQPPLPPRAGPGYTWSWQSLPLPPSCLA